MTSCRVNSNNGRGVWLRNAIAGISIVDSMIHHNSHVGGLHVDGGVGDIIVNDSLIKENQGDGINVSYAGGYKHIYQTSIIGNSRRGVAFWFNETSNWIPFNFTTHISKSNIMSNGDVGVIFGNMCRSDAFWNVSMNVFGRNGNAALFYQSCWNKSSRSRPSVDTLLISNNQFGDQEVTKKLSIRMKPALNVRASIVHNIFKNHESGVIFIENRENEEFLEHYMDRIAEIEIAENQFTDNRGMFVAKLGVVQGSKVQNVSFHHNKLQNNVIEQPFVHLKPRSRVAAVVAVTSNNTIIRRNLFHNPASSYELGSHLEDHSSVINASLNYWGYNSANEDVPLQIYNRIFDRKDRYNLAHVQFLQYLLNGNDLDTKVEISSSFERDKIMRFRQNKEIGGEVIGDITLEQGEYDVKKDIFVRPGSKLFIKPKTTLRFEQSIGMMVQGRLESDGTDGEIIYTLRMATMSDAEEVEPPARMLRLSEGTKGTIEVTINSTTGGVCAYGFSIQSASLVCQQLGMVLSPQDWLMEAESQASSQGTGQVLLSNVQCDEHDTEFQKCKHEILGEDFENSCAAQVGIRCVEPSWSGVRLGVHAKSSTLRNSVIEKAGQLDFSTHTFKPALQVDFNNHILENLTVRDNIDSGIGLMWNDIFKDVHNQVLKFSKIMNNRNHGILTKSQGVDITDNSITNNGGGGVWYDPLFTKSEQRDAIRWISEKATTLSSQLDLNTDERHYIRIMDTAPNIVREFQVNCTDTRTIGIIVVDPFREDSTETLVIRRGRNIDDKSSPLWNVRENLTSFPLRETGFIVTLRYQTGLKPNGGVLLMMSAVQPLGKHINISI